MFMFDSYQHVNCFALPSNSIWMQTQLKYWNTVEHSKPSSVCVAHSPVFCLSASSNRTFCHKGAYGANCLDVFPSFFLKIFRNLYVIWQIYCNDLFLNSLTVCIIFPGPASSLITLFLVGFANSFFYPLSVGVSRDSVRDSYRLFLLPTSAAPLVLTGGFSGLGRAV